MIMKDKISTIFDEIEQEHGFTFNSDDLLAIEEGVKFIEAITPPEKIEGKLDSIIKEAARLIGLRNKYPDLPVQYAFVFSN